jgi:apolipoprotein N-acyltransferase
VIAAAWTRLRTWRWRESRRVFVLSAGAGLAHSLLFVLAMPLLSLWGFSLFAMLPIMLAGMLAARELRDSGGVGLRWVVLGVLLGCLPRELVQHHWTWPVTALGTVPFILIQSFWTALLAALLAWLLGRAFPRARAAPTILFAALLWVGVEYFRARVFMGGYAWGFVVHPLIDWPAAAAISSIGGVWLVSLLVALPNAALAWIALTAIRREREHRTTLPIALAAILLPLGVLALGSQLAPAPRTGEVIPIAIVQTNVPQSNKVAWTLAQEVADFQRFVALTQAAATPLDANAPPPPGTLDLNRPAPIPPTFIVWPETMMPGISIEPGVLAALDTSGVTLGGDAELPGMPGVTRIPATAFAKTLQELQSLLGVPFVIGEEALTNFRATVQDDASVEFSHDDRFNSAFVLHQGQVAQSRYDKIELTPFGESIPFFWRWPGLVQAIADFAAAGMALDLSRGESPVVLNIPRDPSPLRIATPICFEVTVPELHRDLAFANGNRRADLFVNLTNDGWFTTNNQTRLQHLQIARWRCAETATPMVRAANTGISCIIDARGTIMRQGLEPVTDRGELLPRTDQRWLADGVLRDTVTLPAPDFITTYARISLLLGDIFGWLPCATTGAILVFGLFARHARPKPPTTHRTNAPAARTGA